MTDRAPMAPWVTGDNVPLLTDLYELPMLRAYREPVTETVGG